ncbi:TolC family protein [Paraprevotella xylaniphila]|uniref:TolC family protein n=1 Tax=Paraprevotella xylaniphila TaxID=454155 RepID=UPI001032C2BD|nr:TolC family protein [Paraprevotella xylaniphila]
MKRFWVWAMGMCALQGTLSAQLTLEACYRAARENYPLVRQFDLIERTKDFTVENATKSYFPQLSFSGKASYQSDVTKMPFSIPGVEFGLDKDQYQLVLELNQTIWDGGAVRNRKEEARAKSEVQKGQLEVNLYALDDRVNQLFFGMLLIDAQLAQNALLQAQLARNHGQVSACMQQGVANQADLDAVAVEQLNARQTEGELRVNRKAYAEVLGLLTGRKGIDAERLVKPSATVEPLEENRRPELSLYESQRRQLSVQEKGLTARYMPKLGVFAQGAYGDPGLNMLKGGFEPYYIAGLRLSWNISDLYTRKNDKRLLAASRDDIDVQEAVFRLNNRMEAAQHWRTVEKIDTLMKNDDELIRLRTNIRKSAEAKVANGTLTVTEMLREVTAEDQAKQAKALHEIQRLQALYDIKYTMNH